jgi:ketosteroid isomerase-like protein
MSQENVEIARRFYDQLFETGEPLWGVLEAEIEVHDHDVPDAGPYFGPIGVTSWVNNWGQAFEGTEIDLERLVDVGDRVVSLFRMRATGRRSGVSIERKDAIVSTFRDGKVTRIDYYNDQAQALEAVGLSE